MTENEKTTALIPSVGADGGQPPHNSTKQRIPHETCESNPPEENIEEMRERIRRMMLMCHKVTHKKLIDNSPLFRKNFKVEFHGSHTNCVASFA